MSFYCWSAKQMIICFFFTIPYPFHPYPSIYSYALLICVVFSRLLITWIECASIDSLIFGLLFCLCASDKTMDDKNVKVSLIVSVQSLNNFSILHFKFIKNLLGKIISTLEHFLRMEIRVLIVSVLDWMAYDKVMKL